MFLRRNLPADQLRQQQVLNLSGSPLSVLNPNLSGELPCETLSLEAMTRWILCKNNFTFYISTVVLLTIMKL